MWRTVVIWLLLFSFSPASAHSGIYKGPGVINLDCFSESGAFCLRDTGLVVENRGLGDGSTQLKVYAERSKEQASTLRVPRACSVGRSDVVELRGYDSYHVISGRVYIMLILRLRRAGDCDLTILAPAPEGASSDLLGLSLLLSSISICYNSVCEESLIAKVPSRLRDLWF
jgi:hypothetical protein